MFKPVFIVIDKVNWSWLTEDSKVMYSLEQTLDGLFSKWFGYIPNGVRLFTKIDTNAMRENCKEFAEELAAYVFHPLRLQNMSQAYGCELDEYMEYFM